MRERPRHCVYRGPSSVVTVISKLCVSRAALPTDLIVNKLFDFVHRSSGRRRTGIPLDETFGLALEEREPFLASCLAVALDEAIDDGSGYFNGRASKRARKPPWLSRSSRSSPKIFHDLTCSSAATNSRSVSIPSGHAMKVMAIFPNVSRSPFR